MTSVLISYHLAVEALNLLLINYIIHFKNFMKKLTISVALMACVVVAHAGTMTTKRNLVNAELSNDTLGNQTITMVAQKKAATASLLHAGSYTITATVTAVGAAEKVTNEVFTKFLGTNSYTANLVENEKGELELNTDLGVLSGLVVANNGIEVNPEKYFTVEGDAQNRHFNLRGANNKEAVPAETLELSLDEDGNVVCEDFTVYYEGVKVADVTGVKLVAVPTDLIIEPTLGETALVSDHSAISVASASSLEIRLQNGAAVKNVTYAIDRVEDGMEYSVASGLASLNTVAYAEFGKELVFVSGHQYKLTVKAWESADYTDDPTDVQEFYFNGGNETGFVGDIQWGVERGEVSADQANLGISVSFPDVLLPGLADLNNVTAQAAVMIFKGEITADDFAIAQPADQFYVNLSDEGGIWNGMIASENVKFEEGEQYTIVIPSVEIMEGEEVIASLDEDTYFQTNFQVVAPEVTFNPLVTVGGFALDADKDTARTRVKTASSITIEGVADAYDFVEVYVGKVWLDEDGHECYDGVVLENEETWMSNVVKNENGSWTVNFANPEQTFDKNYHYKVSIFAAQCNGDVENWWKYDVEFVEYYFIGNYQEVDMGDAVVKLDPDELDPDELDPDHRPTTGLGGGGIAAGVIKEYFTGVTVSYPENNIDPDLSGSITLQVTKGYICKADADGNPIIENEIASIETPVSQGEYDSVTAFDGEDVRDKLEKGQTYTAILTIELVDTTDSSVLWQDEISYTFTVGKDVGINNVVAAKKIADGKYLVNGKVVIVKNDKQVGVNGALK